MKKIGLLFAFFAVFQVVSLEAQIEGKRWFTEVSAGGGKIYGPALMKKFDLFIPWLLACMATFGSLFFSELYNINEGVFTNYQDIEDEFYLLMEDIKSYNKKLLANKT